MHIYIYITYMYVYIYIYIERERDRERYICVYMRIGPRRQSVDVRDAGAAESRGASHPPRRASCTPGSISSMTIYIYIYYH